MGKLTLKAIAVLTPTRGLGKFALIKLCRLPVR